MMKKTRGVRLVDGVSKVGANLLMGYDDNAGMPDATGMCLAKGVRDEL